VNESNFVKFYWTDYDYLKKIIILQLIIKIYKFINEPNR